MLVNLEPVKLKQIIPQELLEWSPDVWFELKKVLPPLSNYVFEQAGYRFTLFITKNDIPAIMVQNPLEVIKYVHFTYPSINSSLVSEVLTELVGGGSFDPLPLLEGIKHTFDAYLKLYSDLADFQVNANDLAKDYICTHEK